MRAGVLSDDSVAAMVEEGFTAAWEKKGAVVAYRVKEDPKQMLKVGGNVLTYVATSRGEVIHAISGSCSPESYAEQLEWARATYLEMAELTPEESTAYIRAAHVERLQSSLGMNARNYAHRLLATKAYLPIVEVEKDFFQTLLGEVYAPDKEIIIREVTLSDFKKQLGLLMMR